MIETIAAVALLSLMMIVVGKISVMKATGVETIDAQYVVLSADAFLADIYTDFHRCSSFECSELGNGDTSLLFIMRDGGAVVYSFSDTTKKCYKNGVEQFGASRFTVIGGGNKINVSLKIRDERLLEINAVR